MAKILIAEDDEDLLKLFQTVLKREGYEVVTAQDGLMALRYLNKEYADLIISDIMMPNMDGYQLIQALRDAGQKTPILLITAKEGFDKQLLLKFVLDHADYIGYAYTKDFVRDLFQTVRSSIENSKLGNKSDALEKLKEWQERFDKQAEEFAREKNIYNRSMIIDSDALIKAAKERNASGKQLTETTNK